MIVYFSSVSENTHRFVEKLALPAQRIPLKVAQAEQFQASGPYVLVVPTYGGGSLKGAVPKPVIAFLNQPENRRLLRGVIAAGNTNFGTAYGLAGAVVAQKCQVPLLYKFELLGTSDDVQRVRQGISAFLQQAAQRAESEPSPEPASHP
ncbi:class Ib ribonucleoside-diphosphate reductase assembly flavoprotein NrdI [Comamonadaceae bacterium OH2310_COT-174]|uniref:class Ib ribonucleoside-diphosphate reductase assembly flavoprotein NrdI n=1 Tax=Vandammella animalimorsus TaxID=2029117 RepID=UPI000F5F79EF|nr:class Ib ribonucleoside-diphosphate reductase assembly flavoprotein NrdI [Comamonadaceae bacterium OH2310_COT-174]